MMRFIAVCMFAFSGVFCFNIVDRKRDITEPAEIILEGTSTRSFRSLENYPNDNSLVGTFTVEPLDYFDGVPRPELFVYGDSKSAYENAFTDPFWKYQWYMHDYRTKLGPVVDLNVVPVYRMGITGEGINVAIVDSGVDMDHPDLQENLLKHLAYNVPIGKLGDAAPAKSLFTREKENHGTSTAGIVAMTANNSYCGVGIAYNTKIVAIKRDDSGYDYLNGVGLSHAQDQVDIYSNSWGPVDTGTFLDHIGKLSAVAIDQGIKQGRGGLGSIYLFASGNGRSDEDDNCSFDEYVNYIHTIAIGAVKQDGNQADFSETCSAVYAVTFGLGTRSHIIGPTPDGQCTNDFTGTSAATPQAAAIIALVLQANKQLTYRDVMHLITMGSEVAPLAVNNVWKKNAAGFWVSNEFGFGLMNAYNMVKLAMQWTNVPEKTICEFKFDMRNGVTFRTNQVARLKQTSDACQNSEKKEEQVFYLEQLMLTTSIDYPYRGALSIIVKSARGTETEMLTPRKNDKSLKGLNKWQLKSVHNWGEDPRGEWQIEVKAQFLRHGLGNVLKNVYKSFLKPMESQTPDYNETGKLVAFTLWFHGTRDVPDHHTRGLVPRTYSAFSTPDGKTSVKDSF